MSKEEFKLFANSHPELVSYIKNSQMTWQKFYEIYDIYGDDKKAWEPYLVSEKQNSGITNLIDNINTDSIKKHIDTAQKAIGVVQELAGKDKINNIPNISKGPLNPRPINKFFED